jgi:ferric-dicitrate binding protein FerR (iron transport regulator)
MTGEGYFEVTKNYVSGSTRHIPFLVKTGAGSIEVTGTKFNVNAYGDAGKQVTTLLEGVVIVHASGDVIASRQLAPGQRGVLNGGKAIAVQSANTKAATAWMNGRFSFDHASIREVMQQLSRWYDVDIEYGTNFPADAILNGSAERNIPLSELLSNLQATMDENLELRLEGKTIIVRKK